MLRNAKKLNFGVQALIFLFLQSDVFHKGLNGKLFSCKIAFHSKTVGFVTCIGTLIIQKFKNRYNFGQTRFSKSCFSVTRVDIFCQCLQIFSHFNGSYN